MPHEPHVALTVQVSVLGCLANLHFGLVSRNACDYSVPSKYQQLGALG